MSRVGMFGKSFSNMAADLSTGQGLLYSIFGGNSFSNKDIGLYQDYLDVVNDTAYAESDLTNITSQMSVAMQRSAATLAAGGKSAKDLQKSLFGANAATTALNIGFAALNSLAVWGISTAVNAGINTLVKASHSAKIASDEANTTAQESASRAEKTANEAKDIDDKIDKFKSIRSSSIYDASARSQAFNLQNEIVSLLGNETSGIDLVNGKYQEQLQLLQEISKQKDTIAITDNATALHDAINAANSTAVDSDWFINYLYKGKMESALTDTLENLGYSVGDMWLDGINAINGGFDLIKNPYNGQVYVNDKFAPTFGFGADGSMQAVSKAQNELAFLQKLSSDIESNVEGYIGSDLYNGIQSRMREVQSIIDSETKQTN